ncbi:cell division protein ZapA [Erythrobacter litoralis]|uniref:cell division protein ZapA n=1 Tax=Erythrobacter litoralis TaxID=39960 RepID=UPI0024357D54|nr:cell division protein ZapA [Erythrobacter litoralis]MDG6079691.1 cell division protein ZapA [Erythrobacter litoralis]
MSDVRLKVGGRYYTVACADGEEDRLRGLAAQVDEKVASLGAAASANEGKNLLFAAIFLADELDEAKRSAKPAAADDSAMTQRLERIADALEKTADALEAAGQRA